MAVCPKDLTAATIARDRLVRNQTVNSRHAGRSQHLGTNNEAVLLLATADDRALLTLNRFAGVVVPSGAEDHAGGQPRGSRPYTSR